MRSTSGCGSLMQGAQPLVGCVSIVLLLMLEEGRGQKYLPKDVTKRIASDHNRLVLPFAFIRENIT